MSSEPRGASIFPVEVGSVTKLGFLILIDDRELWVPFDAFPWFRNAAIDGLTTVERPNPNHLYWPKLDVDLAVEFIEYPTFLDREMPFGTAAHQVLAQAGDEAQRLCHPYVGTEHLVLALTRQTQGTLATVLRTLSVDGERVRATIETTVDPGITVVRSRRLSYTDRLKNVFGLAKRCAWALGDREIDAAHLLFGVLAAKGMGCGVLLQYGLSEDAVMNEIRRFRRREGT